MPLSFVVLPAGTSKKRNSGTSAEELAQLAQYPLSTLGELVLRTTQSSISSFPHPSVPLQYFECIVRYHDFFLINPAPIPTVIQAFLDQRYGLLIRRNATLIRVKMCRGLHQESKAARGRCFYLFHRFIFYAKDQIQKNVSPEFITEILNAIQVGRFAIMPSLADREPCHRTYSSSR